ncbi:unnamed protein product [marine sediment metagenome]|uniref:Uncharacterized protein n=1 Tax=marine sediment metagenome TaxID=412755 RepID=X1FBW1_9ZZZZ
MEVCDCSGNIDIYTLKSRDLDIDLTRIITQKKIAVGNPAVAPGSPRGGNHIKMVVRNHIGKPINKNGRRFPNFPGFLLSTITPKIIAKNAETIN